MSWKSRDKAEMAIATLILLAWFIGFELTGVAGEPGMGTRVIVLGAAFTIFGDNLAKARELTKIRETNDTTNN